MLLRGLLCAGAAAALAPAPARPRRRVAVRAGNDYYSFRRENDPDHDGTATADRGDAAARAEANDADAGPASGQTHFQKLHQAEMEDGILTHLTEMGLTLREAAEALGESLFGAQGPVAFSETAEARELQKHARQMEQEHLRDLLASAERVAAMTLEAPGTGVFLDWTRQKVNAATMAKLFELAEAMEVPRKIAQMRRGARINTSERRAVLHTALRAHRGDAGFLLDEADEACDPATDRCEDALLWDGTRGSVEIDEAIQQSCDVRERLLAFVDDVRNGGVAAASGAPFEAVVVVGIGGSYLGPEFVTQACLGATAPAADGAPLTVRFVANVDPVAFDRATTGLDPTRTLAIVVSKSWTTAETLRNAAKTRRWIVDGCADVADEATVVRAHFVACASRTAAPEVEAWGVDSETRLFEFWNWVGGRYSSTSSAGVLPLALARGSTAARAFLDGARAMDRHFFETPLEENVPAVMALLGIWNVNFLGLGARAVVPYSEALARFAAHVQQLEMESHGKSVTIDGRPLDFTAGEVVIGEPGTNAQHSFFQLLHQGQAVPADFVGFLRPDDATTDVRGHDELMANFFAQPDALAVGRAFDDVLYDGGGDLDTCPHRTLSGDRPSLTLLLDKLDPFHVGALLALYEHRCAVQGFVWDINSFDQWGVQLGKDLAADVRGWMAGDHKGPPPNPSTAAMLRRYAEARGGA